LLSLVRRSSGLQNARCWTCEVQHSAGRSGLYSAGHHPGPTLCLKSRQISVPGMADDRHCETCGKAFPPRQGSGGRPQRFCSRSCQMRASNSQQQMRHAAEWRTRRQTAIMAAEKGIAGTTCLSCGAMFAPIRSDARYCSTKCQQRAYDRPRRDRQRGCKSASAGGGDHRVLRTRMSLSRHRIPYPTPAGFLPSRTKSRP
jgi:predicted nucleic acid-binding Zn ribbon protein